MKIENLEVVNMDELNDVLSHSSKIDREVSGKLTGYPSIDKPWLKYYREKPIRKIDSNQTMYQAITSLNSENLDYDAIGYLNTSIDYKSLFNKVDVLACNLIKMGIKKDDVVLLSLPSVPEASLLLLALNKIGAVSKWIDLRVKNNDFEHYINEHESKYVFIFDILTKSMEEIIDNTDVKKAVIINPVESLGAIPKVVYNIKGRMDGTIDSFPKDKRFVKFSKLLDKNNKIDFEASRFDAERPSLIIQSSGTTGMAKSIVHTDYSVNESIKKFSYMDLPLYAGNTVLVTVPTWIAYGLINSYYLALAFGMKAQLCPKVDRDTVFENLGNFDVSFAAPLHYRYLADNIDKCPDLSRIDVLISGGDKFSAEEIKEITRVLSEKGFRGQILNGYGNNEGLGAESVNPMQHNKFGTVGIPFYGDDICAVDSDNNELKVNEKGEICVRTNTEFLEYAGNPKETALVKQVHPDGKSWIHTGDLGTVDEEGFLHLEGRLKRVIIRRAFKIFPGTIENVINSHPMVKECVTVGVNDSEELSVPMAFISFKPECNDIQKALDEVSALCENLLKEYEVPKYFECVDEIPYTQNNKQDYRKLESIGNKKISENQKVKKIEK